MTRYGLLSSDEFPLSSVVSAHGDRSEVRMLLEPGDDGVRLAPEVAVEAALPLALLGGFAAGAFLALASLLFALGWVPEGTIALALGGVACWAGHVAASSRAAAEDALEPSA